MKKFLLSLAAVALCASFGMAQGNVSETWTLAKDNVSATFPCTFSPKDGITWTINKTGSGTLQNLDSTKGQQFGSSKTPIATLTITTDSFSDKDITEIVVNTSCANSGNSSLSVKVGDTVLSNNNTNAYTLTTTPTDVVFNASSTCKGNIELKWSVSAKAIYVKSITVKYNDGPEDTRTDAGLSFPGTEYTANLGESFTAPELTKATNADVIYTSSKPEVATVDAATGAVTLVAAGTTTITATCEENDTFKAGKAQYTLTVIDPNALDATFDFTPSTTTGTSFTSGIVTAEFAKAEGSTNPAWFSTNTAMRLYAKNTLTITVPDDYYLTSIEFTTASSNGDFLEGTSVANGTLNTNDKTWACNSGEQNSAVTLTNGTVTSGHTRIQKIIVRYAKKAPIEKTDFAWEGIASSSDDVVIEDYDIWMPENMDATVSVMLPTGFKGDSDKFDWILAWNEEASNPLSYNIENGNMVLKSTEAGIFNYSLSIKNSIYYNDSNAFDGQKNIYVYPSAVEHFNIYDNDDAANYVEEDGKFRLFMYEDLNPNGEYKYYYLFEPKASAAEAPRKVIADEHSKYTEYNHEEGIVFNKQEGTLNLIMEKNGVKSAKPYQLKVGPNESTGVEAIGAEAGEAVYFDLQGRRVNGQPEQGLYIVRKGGKTSKIIL